MMLGKYWYTSNDKNLTSLDAVWTTFFITIDGIVEIIDYFVVFFIIQCDVYCVVLGRTNLWISRDISSNM